MTDTELTKELCHFLRNATTPIGGFAALVKRNAWDLHVEGKDDARIHLIINCLDLIMQSIGRMELEMVDMERMGIHDFLQHRKIMYQAERER